MVAGHPALIFFRVFEHREVDDPEGFPPRGEQAGFDTKVGMANLQTQGAQTVPDNLSFVGPKEDDVAVLSADAREDPVELFVREVLDDRGLQPFAAAGKLIDLDVGESLGTVNFDELGVAVDFRARQLGCTRHTHRHNLAVMERLNAREHLESGVFNNVGDFMQTQADAQIGLVRTILGHCVVPQHHRERIDEVDVKDLFEDRTDEFFHQAADFVHVEEGRFNIHLSEFRLTVGTKIFVAETLDDLVITVEPSNHQQLLEELR